MRWTDHPKNAIGNCGGLRNQDARWRHPVSRADCKRVVRCVWKTPRRTWSKKKSQTSGMTAALILRGMANGTTIISRRPVLVVPAHQFEVWRTMGTVARRAHNNVGSRRDLRWIQYAIWIGPRHRRHHAVCGVVSIFACIP